MEITGVGDLSNDTEVCDGALEQYLNMGLEREALAIISYHDLCLKYLKKINVE